MASPTPRTIFLLSLALVLSIWLVFGRTVRHGFIHYDDPDYVYKNAQVSRGLTSEGVRWAFTQVCAANWHPLTWLSHMADCQLFGLRAGGHHFINVLLHSVTAVLLFLLLREMTGALWRSAFVAALFALHPLRVESVAWVAERKDLLSGLFFVLTLGAYARYARAPWSVRRYTLVLFLFALGLMCKPMLVTMPLLLLLLDYWPLNRLAPEPGENQPRISLSRLIAEKLPLLGMAAASASITLFAQANALQTLAKLPLSLRLENAALSAVTYLSEMIWPSALAPFYPFDPGSLVFTKVLLSIALLAGISAAVFILHRRRYLITGWLWYLLMLMPVLGIVQVGAQAHADRYTYLPQIGLALATTWGATDLAIRWRHSRFVLGSIAAILLGALAFLAHQQIWYWRESETLWRRTLACTSNNVVAEQNLGCALYEKGLFDEAVTHLERALAISPNQASVHSTLGVVLLETGKPTESLAHLQRAVALAPNDGEAHYNLANTLMAMGSARAAVSQYRQALEKNPFDIEAMNNMAWLLATASDSSTRNGSEAVAFAERADSFVRGKNPLTSATLAAAYAETGRFEDAIAAAERALNLASSEGKITVAEMIQAHLRSYHAREPIRDRR